MRKFKIVPMAIIVAAALSGPVQGQSREQNPVIAPTTPVIAVGEGGPAPVYVWAGTWFSNKYVGGYVGGMVALNNERDLWSDGVVLRADFSGGRYEYDSTGFTDRHVGLLDGSIMLGYRAKVGKGSLAVYAGPSYIEHDNRDPLADLRGDKFGGKFMVEYSMPLGQNFEWTGQGSYNTAFDTFSLAGRLLYRVSETVQVGGQATLYGNEAPYRESGFGPMLKVNAGLAEIGLSGGYRHVYTSGHKDGYYGSIYLGVPLN